MQTRSQRWGCLTVTMVLSLVTGVSADVMDKAQCRQANAKGIDLSVGDLLLRCTFQRAGATEVLLSTQPLGGSAQVVEANP